MMKNFFKVLVLAVGLVLCFNMNSFANISFSVWCGGNIASLYKSSEQYGYFPFKSQLIFYNSFFDDDDEEDGLFDFEAAQVGLKGHYNLLLSSSFNLALGGFFQFYADGHGKRTAAGADAALSIVRWSGHPYIRATYSFYDRYRSTKGNGFGIGGGIEYPAFSIMKVFAELMYENASYKKSYSSYDIKLLTFNAGITLMF